MSRRYTRTDTRQALAHGLRASQRVCPDTSLHVARPRATRAGAPTYDPPPATWQPTPANTAARAPPTTGETATDEASDR